jgi:outer membrane biosynthesis protein TonB
MSISARSPYEEPEPSTPKWVIRFILLSLLAHAIIITAILLITIFMPPPKIKVPEPSATTLTLTQVPAPAPAPPKQPIFIPTTPAANVVHKPQPVESANDRDLASKNKTARAPDSIMPDVTGKKHESDLKETPKVEAPPKPEVSSTPPTPKEDKPQKPTPLQPNPSLAKQPPPRPPEPNPKPLPPTPPQKAPPQLDANGFPILPALNVPTMAPPNSAAQPLAPVASEREQVTDAHGAVGLAGDTSPAAMKTALGAYEQKVWVAVGSRWYPKIDNSQQLLGVGVVHIQFTIHSDGTVDTKVLDDVTGNMQILSSISVNSIRESAPFDPFPPDMVKELIDQGGDGTSYTNEMSFSIYGN